MESGQKMWQTIPGLWGFSLENVVDLLGILSPLCPQLYLTQVPVNTRGVSTWHSTFSCNPQISPLLVRLLLSYEEDNEAEDHRRWVAVRVSQFSQSVQSLVMSDSLQPHEPQHSRPPCPSPVPGVHPNTCPSSRWCRLTISSSVVPFSSCPQSFPASGSFQMSQLFAWGGQSIEVSASTSVLSMHNQDWSLLGWTGWISLKSKGLSRVFSNTTVQNHQFFSTQLSL